MQNTVLAHPVEKNVTPVRLDPVWDKARSLLAEGRHCACELAAEIARLRGAFEHGGARRGSSSQTVNLNQGAGFVAQLAAQLGLHPQQAKRIEEAASYQLRIEQVATSEEGSAIEVPDKGGATRCIVLTAEHIAQAKQAVAGMALPGAPRPSRAWAGIVGEGDRVGVQGKGKADRQPIDHERNIRRGLVALATSLEHWAEVPAAQRMQIESAWREIVDAGLIPTTWARL